MLRSNLDENTDSYLFFSRVNSTSEWLWDLCYNRYMPIMMWSIGGATIISVLISFMIKGHFDKDYLFHISMIRYVSCSQVKKLIKFQNNSCAQLTLEPSYTIGLLWWICFHACVWSNKFNHSLYSVDAIYFDVPSSSNILRNIWRFDRQMESSRCKWKRRKISVRSYPLSRHR